MINSVFIFRVIDSCQEAFILRLYRQKNKVSWWYFCTVIVEDSETTYDSALYTE